MRKPLHQITDEIQATPEGKRWLDLVRNYVLDIREVDFEWNPPQLNANQDAEDTVTISGLNVGDYVLAVVKPTFTSGFFIGQARVSAANTVGIHVVNATVGNVDPPLETYTLVYIKNTSN